MKPAKTDPKVSCPIVCGEYMRATGFFFKANNQTYLITARHNVLPTDSTTFETGTFQMHYCTRDYLPTVDIYLRGKTTSTVERIDLRNQRDILIDERIDIIGIPVDIDPQQHGYVSWSHNDITTPTTSSTLDSIGYPGNCFPDGNYDTEMYSQEITNPYVLSLEEPSHANLPITDQTGLIAIAIDTGPTKPDTMYNGYSGSPILGDGLLGIHCSNRPATITNTKANETTKINTIQYWQANTLNDLVNKQPQRV